MKRAAGLLVSTSILGFVSHAMAEPRPKTQAKSRPELVLFRTADSDGSGSVSLGEFALAVQESFARRIHERFQQLDRNRDGRCRRSEVNKMSAARFARFDLNADGQFTLAELTQVMNEELEKRLVRVSLRLDVDGNGELSLAELTPRPKKPAPAPVEVAGLPNTNVH